MIPLFQRYSTPLDIYNYSLSCKQLYAAFRETNLKYRDEKRELFQRVRAIDIEEIKFTTGIKEEHLEIYKSQFPYLHLIFLISLYGERLMSFKTEFTTQELDQMFLIPEQQLVEQLEDSPIRQLFCKVVIRYIHAFHTHPSLTEEFFREYWKKFKITSFCHAVDGFPSIPTDIFKTFCEQAKTEKEPIRHMSGWTLNNENCVNLLQLLKVRKIEKLEIRYDDDVSLLTKHLIQVLNK